MTRSSPMPSIPGLDGLRAVAVVLVVIYHANVNWLPAGFLGVDVFFVISGYLITSLLLTEWRERQAIDLKNFWFRRARRLLPAAFLTVLAVLIYAVVHRPDQVADLRANAIAAFTYVTNWYLIVHQVSYFEGVNHPPLLQHLWSLAVEEQFYLLWPLVLTFTLRRWRPGQLAVGVLLGALLSTAWMAYLYHPTVDPSRIYFGTDTRASAPLVGATLACVWSPWRSERRLGRMSVAGLEVIGLCSLGLLLYLCYCLDDYHPILYRGGFLAVALLAAIAIALVVHPQLRAISSILSIAPLRWIGLRSYSIYLWHWPIFGVTQPGLDVPVDGLQLVALRLVATAVIAEASYRFVEKPIRGGAIERIWHAWRSARGIRRLAISTGWGAASGLSVALAVSVASATQAAPESYVPTDDSASASLVSQASVSAVPTAIVVPTPVPAASVPAASVLTAPAPTAPAPTAPVVRTDPVAVKPPEITAIGDSVMLGAAPQLRAALGNVVVDAAVGRQVSAAIQDLRYRQSVGSLGDVVVIHMGNNGTFTTRQFDEMMDILRSTRLVIFVNDKVPRDWETPNDQVIAEGVARYRNAVLVDWRAASRGQSDLFWGDGIHLRPAGASYYSHLIARLLPTS